MLLNLNTSNFKRIPLKQRFKLKLPQYPPQIIIICLILFNLIMTIFTQNPTLYQLFAYVYGTIMLFDASIIAFHLKATLLINVFIVWCNLQSKNLTLDEQKIVFAIIALLFIRVLGYALYEILKSLVFVTPIRFEHVFWTMQIGVFFDFFYHFSGLKYIRMVPNGIRIFQNLQVMSINSITGIIRLSLKIYQFYLIPLSIEWISLQILMGFWDTYLDYTKHFVMKRIYSGQTCFYPKKVIICLFIINVLMVWTWPLSSTKTKSTCKVIRRICWNYVKLESRASESPGKHVLLQILRYYTKKEVDDICL